MDRIENVQYHAALATTGTWQGTSRINYMRNWDGKASLIEDGYDV